VHERERGVEPVIREVGEEWLELWSREHALVDDRAWRQRSEVDLDLAFDALARAEGEALELDATDRRIDRRDEELPEARHHRARARAGEVGHGREFTPPEQLKLLLGDDALDCRYGGAGGEVVGGQEGDADGIAADGRQLEVDDRTEEVVRDLGQQAGAVAGVDLPAGSAAVLEIAKRRQCVDDHFVAAAATQIGDEGNATGVMLVRGVVKTVRRIAGQKHGSPVVSCGGAEAGNEKRRHLHLGAQGRRWPCCQPVSLTILT